MRIDPPIWLALVADSTFAALEFLGMASCYATVIIVFSMTQAFCRDCG